MEVTYIYIYIYIYIYTHIYTHPSQTMSPNLKKLFELFCDAGKRLREFSGLN